MAEKRIPRIRVGEHWIPAHRMWNVVETIKTATDLVEKFNDEREPLSNETTREVVNTVRTRIRDMELSMGGEGAFEQAAIDAGLVDAEQQQEAARSGSGDTDVAEAGGSRGATELGAEEETQDGLDRSALAEAARQLLDAMSLDEALTMLRNDYGEQIDARDVFQMVGREAYLDNLSREAKELVANMIVPEQIAELWNESRYPSPIGGLWTKGDVDNLLK